MRPGTGEMIDHFPHSQFPNPSRFPFPLYLVLLQCAVNSST